MRTQNKVQKKMYFLNSSALELELLTEKKQMSQNQSHDSQNELNSRIPLHYDWLKVPLLQ